MAKQLAHEQAVLAEYLWEHQAAAELRQSLRTIRLWRQIGTGPAWTKIGRTLHPVRPAVSSP
jgi:hypothetical protein